MLLHRTFLVIALSLVGSTNALTQEQIEAAIQPILSGFDQDVDGQLSLAEFSAMCESYLITEDFFYNHGSTYAGIFSAIDLSSDGYLSLDDLGYLATANVQDLAVYAEPLIGAFTNGVSAPPDMTQLFPTQSVTEAKATVNSKMTLTGITPAQLTPKRRQDILAYYLALEGVMDAKVVYRVAGSRRRLEAARPTRALQSSDTEIEAMLYVVDDAAALNVEEALPASAAEATTLPAFTGLPVGTITIEADVAWVPPMTGLIVTLVLLLIIGFSLCLCASMFARMQRKKVGLDAKSCCDTGCCSYFAVKPWALGNFIACICILYGVSMMYSAISPLQTALIGLTDALWDVLYPPTPLSPEAASFVNQLPADALESILAQRSLLQYLGFAVMGPGVVAVIFLLFASICPIIPRRKGSFCCTKIFILLSYVVLLIALIFYFIFTAVPLALAYAPESVQVQLRLMTSMCVTVPLSLEQIITDGNALVASMAASGQDTSAFTDPSTGTLALAQSTLTVLSAPCNYIGTFLDAFNELFLPGTVCVVAICFAFYANLSLCSSAGCCCPVKVGNEKVADSSLIAA